MLYRNNPNHDSSTEIIYKHHPKLNYHICILSLQSILTFVCTVVNFTMASRSDLGKGVADMKKEESYPHQKVVGIELSVCGELRDINKS